MRFPGRDKTDIEHSLRCRPRGPFQNGSARANRDIVGSAA